MNPPDFLKIRNSTIKRCGVQPQAWGPLAEGRYGIFTNEILTKIAEKYEK